MIFLIPAAIGLGMLLSGCASKDEEPKSAAPSDATKKEEPPASLPLPEETISTPNMPPRGIPPQFFVSDPSQISSALASEIKKRTQMCAQRWGSEQMDNCSIYAATKIALQYPLDLDSMQMRAWARDELARFYEGYLKSSPGQRVLAKNFISIQNLETILLTSQFGRPLTGSDIDRILSEVRSKTGLGHIPPARKIPITWEKIGSSQEPVDVRIQDVPQDLIALAKQVKLQKDAAQHLGLPAGGDLWDFISANTDSVTFAKQLPSTYSGQIIAEAKTLFFKTVVIDIDASKSILKNDYLVALLSSLAHECYHNYFHHRYKMRDERYVDTFMLNERNAYLLGAETVAQNIRQKSATTADRNLLRSAIYFMANDMTTGMAANACLGYELFDRNLHGSIPGSADKKTINSHPSGCLRRYFAALGTDPTRFLYELIRQLNLFPTGN